MHFSWSPDQVSPAENTMKLLLAEIWPANAAQDFTSFFFKQLHLCLILNVRQYLQMICYINCLLAGNANLVLPIPKENLNVRFYMLFCWVQPELSSCHWGCHLLQRSLYALGWFFSCTVLCHQMWFHLSIHSSHWLEISKGIRKSFLKKYQDLVKHLKKRLEVGYW